jgi:hypothetical protein
MSLEARTNLRVFAIIGVAADRSGEPRVLVTIRKVVYTREAADASIDKLNAEGDGRHYFWQLTSIEPLG